MNVSQIILFIMDWMEKKTHAYPYSWRGPHHIGGYLTKKKNSQKGNSMFTFHCLFPWCSEKSSQNDFFSIAQGMYIHYKLQNAVSEEIEARLLAEKLRLSYITGWTARS